MKWYPDNREWAEYDGHNLHIVEVLSKSERIFKKYKRVTVKVKHVVWSDMVAFIWHKEQRD